MLIYYLATKDHRYTIGTYLESMGKGLSVKVVPLAYEALFDRMTRNFWLKQAKHAYWEMRREAWSSSNRETFQRAGKLLLATYKFLGAAKTRPAVYIFTDLERLSPEAAEKAFAVWQSLSLLGGVRLLNHPTRSMRRYELLRTLYERGINSFNVYRLTEARWPQRYPVFLRRENDHGGPISALLRTREELEAALGALDREGRSREGIMITEFCDTADAEGIYRKFGAFLIGDRIIPNSVQFSKHWVQKSHDLNGEAMLREEREYVKRNPNEDQLREIFRLARIDYGRVDYGLLKGRVQVWEINTNPAIGDLTAPRNPARVAVREYVGRELAGALERISRD